MGCCYSVDRAGIEPAQRNASLLFLLSYLPLCAVTGASRQAAHWFVHVPQGFMAWINGLALLSGSSRNRTCHGLIYSQPCHLGSSTPLAEDAGIEPAGPFSRASLAKRLLTIRLYSMCGSDRNRTRYGVTRDCFQDSSPPLASLPSTRPLMFGREYSLVPELAVASQR